MINFLNSINDRLRKIINFKKAVPERNVFLEQIVNSANLQTNLVFQRFHYFLLSIAFLVTAFVALMSTDLSGNNIYRLYIALAVTAIGYFLSFFFTFVNYYNSQQVNAMWLLYNNMDDSIDNLEEFYDKALKLNLLVNLSFCKHVWIFMWSPFSNKMQAPYTWFIAFFFCLVWWFASLFVIFYFVFPEALRAACILIPPMAFAYAIFSINRKKSVIKKDTELINYFRKVKIIR